MRAKTVALLAAITAVALTAGTAAALPSAELAPENDTVGICVVGVDSPCNGEEASDSTDERLGDSDSGEGKMWIPEDQNRDGEIDERFGGDTDESTDEQIFLPEDQNRDGEIDERFEGDSDRTGDSDRSDESHQTTPGDHHHETSDHSDGDAGTEIGDTDDSTNEQIFLPEDQNRDGDIDERFRGSVPEFLGGLLTDLFGLY